MKRFSRMLTSALAAAALVCAVAVPASAVPHFATGGIYEDTSAKFGDNSKFAGGTFLPPIAGEGFIVAPDTQIRNGDNFYDLVGSTKVKDETVWVNGINNGQLTQTFKPGDAILDVMFAYVPHGHKVSPDAPWHYDNNNHWKDCETCPCWVLMNYHHDVDNNGKCDQCGSDIVYRNVTVKDSVGGKVKVSANKCVLGDRVAVTVDADPGFKLVSLKGLNDNGKSYSIRPCFEDIKGSQYHFFVDVWDVEVQAVFEKE